MANYAVSVGVSNELVGRVSAADRDDAVCPDLCVVEYRIFTVPCFVVETTGKQKRVARLGLPLDADVCRVP